MKLYLVRHGEAVSKQEDAQRPLSAAGKATVRRVGEFLGGTLGEVGALYCSTKLRARETAQVLTDAAGVRVEASELPSLAPLADIEESVGLLDDVPAGDVMLIGHLPHLNRLASRLAMGDAELEAFAFAAGSVLCLRRTEEGPDRMWQVAWFLTPELIDRGGRGDD